jgi:3-oxoacyl-[acyl-carrier protein] reductase
VETDLTRQNNSETQIRQLADQTAVKRLARPDEIAQWAFLLGSEFNTYFTGQELVIDGGFSCQ